MTTLRTKIIGALGYVPRLEPRRKQNPRRFIVVDSKSYSVFKRGESLRAILKGWYGWQVIYADTYEALVKRVRLARQGGQ